MLSLRLALADLWHERGLAACFIVALAAIMAPLLVLLGLKTGVVDTLRTQLVQDPRIREIASLGNRSTSPAEIADLGRIEGISFIVPRTRQLAATANLARASGTGATIAELIATAPGDPLLDGIAIPAGDNQLVLSSATAERMAVETGDSLRLAVQRKIGDAVEVKSLTVTIVGIAGPGAFGRDGAFVSLDLLEALEDYRDGRAVARLGWDGPAAPGPRSYAGFRAVAGQVEDVARLARAIEARGYTVTTRADEIEVVLRLDRNLTAMFAIIAAIGGAGFALSLGASLIGHVARKRVELSLLRLMGLSLRGMAGFPVFQGIAIALGGSVLAVAVFIGTSAVINTTFSAGLPGGEALCRLSVIQMATVGAMALVTAMLSALAAGFAAARIEPGEGIRNG